jgi:hypothetical protein
MKSIRPGASILFFVCEVTSVSVEEPSVRRMPWIASNAAFAMSRSRLLRAAMAAETCVDCSSFFVPSGAGFSFIAGLGKRESLIALIILSRFSVLHSLTVVRWL